MKKILKCVAMIVPWCLVFVLLITPEPSVKLNNLIRGGEFYFLQKNGSAENYKYDITELVEQTGDPDLSNLETAEKHEVTDEDVVEEINNELSNYTDKTELQNGMTVESGMNANIDYAGTVVDAVVDGINGTSQDIALGSDVIMEGLDAEIEGHSVGETFDVSLEIPESFNETLAGKTVKFSITINSASVDTEVSLDSVTDEFVKKNISGYDTVEDYKAGMRKEVEEYFDLEFENGKKITVLTALKDVCKVSIPDELLDQETEIYAQQFTNMYCKDQTLEEYLSTYYDTSLEDFYDTIKDDVKISIENVLVCQYFANKLKIKVTDEYLKDYVDELATGTSYSSENMYEIYDMYKTDYMGGREYLERMALCDMVVEHFMDGAVFSYTDESAEDSDGAITEED